MLHGKSFHVDADTADELSGVFTQGPGLATSLAYPASPF